MGKRMGNPHHSGCALGRDLVLAQEKWRRFSGADLGPEVGRDTVLNVEPTLRKGSRERLSLKRSG
jgi:hypothetical protein